MGNELDALIDTMAEAILARGDPDKPMRVELLLKKRDDGKWWAVMSVDGFEICERGPFLNRDTAERARRKIDRAIAQSGLAQRAREGGGTDA